MRNISFSLTGQQIRDRTKTVTRRLGWQWLVAAVERGERPVLRACEKCQGLKKGERIKPLAVIRVVSAWQENVYDLCNGGYEARDAQDELRREGFPHLTPNAFVEMFCHEMRVKGDARVTRIEFEYVDEPRAKKPRPHRVFGRLTVESGTERWRFELQRDGLHGRRLHARRGTVIPMERLLGLLRQQPELFTAPAKTLP